MSAWRLIDFRSSLDALGLKDGDTVLVQSSLIELGILTDVPLSKFVGAVYDEIRQCVGVNGTIVATTFSFGSTKGDMFDPESTPSKNGVLSEFIRKQPKAIRSPHPIQSVSAVGPMAADICHADPKSFYDETGPFGKLFALNAKVLLIGRRNVETASLSHYAEEQMQVPYRYWKEFIVPYQFSGKITPRKYSMFVRDANLDSRIDLRTFSDHLEKSGALNVERVGASDIRMGYIRGIVSEACLILARNPWAFVAGQQQALSYANKAATEHLHPFEL